LQSAPFVNRWVRNFAGSRGRRSSALTNTSMKQ
jgi:hypothetical protein